MAEYPQLLHTVVDAVDIRELAEFYRKLLGLAYAPGSKPPASGEDDEDWLVLADDGGRRVLAFQQVAELTPTTWPEDEIPMQLHLDFTVSNADELSRHRNHAEQLGARLLFDRTDDPEEPLYVLADPAGHPFCLFV